MSVVGKVIPVIVFDRDNRCSTKILIIQSGSINLDISKAFCPIEGRGSLLSIKIIEYGN